LIKKLIPGQSDKKFDLQLTANFTLKTKTMKKKGNTNGNGKKLAEILCLIWIKQDERNEKQKEIISMIDQLMRMIRPKLSFLPRITAMRADLVKDSLENQIIKIISYSILNREMSENAGFIELGNNGKNQPVDVLGLIKELNSILDKFSLIAKVGKNSMFQSPNGAIKIIRKQ
jgi:hypothetical protein